MHMYIKMSQYTLRYIHSLNNSQVILHWRSGCGRLIIHLCK